MARADWLQMDNNRKAAFGKARFLEVTDGADATSERVREWLCALSLNASRSAWAEVAIAPDLAGRFVNLAYSSRCVDAFIHRDGSLRGCELKVSGDDGVCGLTVSEERLLRAGHISVYSVNPVRGLIGEMNAEALLSVPRRIDGIPVGDVRIQWL